MGKNIFFKLHHHFYILIKSLKAQKEIEILKYQGEK